MTRSLALVLMMLSLSGCGVVETGAAAATEASAQAEQARQARQTMDRMKQQIDAASQQSATRANAAESDSQ